MSLDYIRNHYSVPARKGGRIEYTGGKVAALGTITGAEGAHLLVKMDGSKCSQPYHPTWKLRYLDGDAAAKEPST